MIRPVFPFWRAGYLLLGCLASAKNLALPVSWRHCWPLGIGVALGISSGIAFSGNRALAQIIPDTTLGVESSVVTPLDPDLPVDVIDGGAQRGQNLFHSFQDFNVSENRGVYFYSSDANIQNILARITGANRSDILGTLGTFGESQPSLFLINPNGIIFGPNANLDIGGSFVATTANAVGLGETGRFSASEPQTSNLLAINPNAFFFNQFSNQGQIVNRSTATSTVLGFSVNGLPFTYGLQVLGRSLLLLGGNVNLEGGIVFAPGGRVELGGLAGAGTVRLDTNGNLLNLSFLDGVARADVSLNNQAVLDVVANDGGSIAIHSRNINIFGNSKLWAGIWSGLGTVDSQAGDITLDATDAVTVVDSNILNEVQEQAIGNGGNINIRAESLSLSGDSDYVIVSADTHGQGNAGSVSVQVSGPVSLNSSRISSQVLYGAVGNSGGINIQAQSLRMTDGAELYAQVAFARGNAGDISIKVADSVEVIDGSVIVTYAGDGAVGNGGNISLEARSLFMENNASLLAETLGQGNAGNISVQVADFVTLIDSYFYNAAANDEEQTVGNGGNITVEARSLFMADGSELKSSTDAQGNAGNILVRATDSVELIDSHILSHVELDDRSYIETVGNGGDITIETRSLSLTDASLNASTQGQGHAGSIFVRGADSVLLSDSSISTAVKTEGIANQPSNIEIHTRSLALTNNSQIDATTSGRGDGGTVSVIAPGGSISLANNSSIKTAVEVGAIGQGGDIKLTANSISLTGGSRLEAQTRGEGDAGNIQLDATEFVDISGANPLGLSSGILTSTETSNSGKGGKITVGLPHGSLDSLRLSDGSVLSARTLNSAPGGDIEVNVDQLEITTGGQIITSASSLGSAGNINIRATESVTISGSNPNFIDRGGSTGNTGNGIGRVSEIEPNNSIAEAQFIAPELFSLQANPDIEASTDIPHVSIFGTGDGTFDYYSLMIQAPGSRGIFEIDNSSAAGTGYLDTQIFLFDSAGRRLTQNDDSSTALGAGGSTSRLDSFISYEIETPGIYTIGVGRYFSFAGNGSIAGNPLAPGNQYTLQVSIDNRNTNPNQNPNSGLFAQATNGGTAGNLTIETGQMFVRDGGQVTVSSPQGQAGNLSITANTLTLNQGTISAVTGTSGAEGGANITLKGLDFLRMDNESLISASALGNANGGNVTIDSTFIVATPPTGPEGSDIIANAEQGNGGRVYVTTQGLFGIQFRPQRTPKNDITVSSTFGLSGEFALNTPGVDPSRGLAQLPVNVVDASQQIDQRCTPKAANQGGSFTVTGRGGIPPSPNDTLQAESLITPNWVILDSERENNTSSAPTTPSNSAPKQLVEAQGWRINEQGQVVLTASAPNVTPHNTWQTPVECTADANPVQK
ncbi:two-partner secretion domain-containing protein [Allocoleopsis franciscana]|uniref:Filamentous hemagglutinin family N-terminal domain protein n=1 Tax=Allocoleopsis franciscana PCC 7113 TaxID=1173027 RepID=K9W7L1_9CYAN|nr:filamentous hemagglutinin N-terminal domain-containing protein [Allocoleopsis franciscana]AFZ16198.1 filamentous hemagglutinin family N-terminal domain protein [Allocoleopsis franciscana PCC 7113]